MKFEDVQKHILSKFDAKEIVRSARLFGQCQCDRSDHDHPPMSCHRRLGARAKIVYKEDAPHVPSALNVIVVCPRCFEYIGLEKGRISG
jgi:hypothetical protein